MKNFAIIDNITDKALQSIKKDIVARYKIDLDEFISAHSKCDLKTTMISLYNLLFENNNYGLSQCSKSVFQYKYFIYDALFDVYYTLWYSSRLKIINIHPSSPTKISRIISNGKFKKKSSITFKTHFDKQLKFKRKIKKLFKSEILKLDVSAGIPSTNYSRVKSIIKNEYKTNLFPFKLEDLFIGKEKLSRFNFPLISAITNNFYTSPWNLKSDFPSVLLPANMVKWFSISENSFDKNCKLISLESIKTNFSAIPLEQFYLGEKLSGFFLCISAIKNICNNLISIEEQKRIAETFINLALPLPNQFGRLELILDLLDNGSISLEHNTELNIISPALYDTERINQFYNDLQNSSLYVTIKSYQHQNPEYHISKAIDFNPSDVGNIMLSSILQSFIEDFTKSDIIKIPLNYCLSTRECDAKSFEKTAIQIQKSILIAIHEKSDRINLTLQLPDISTIPQLLFVSAYDNSTHLKQE